MSGYVTSYSRRTLVCYACRAKATFVSGMPTTKCDCGENMWMDPKNIVPTLINPWDLYPEREGREDDTSYDGDETSGLRPIMPGGGFWDAD